MYWHGPWQDLCRGPHLAHTGQVPADAFKLMSVAGAYWRGDSRRPMLQRIYGIAFRSRDELKAYLHQLEEAQKRDHRKLGREMDLFHLQAGGAGLDLLAPQRLHPLAGARGLHPPPARRRRLRRGQDPAAARLRALGAVRPLGQVPREHVRGARRDPRHRRRQADPLRQGRPDGAEADELPRPHPDLQAGHQVLPRPAAPDGRVRLLPPQRGPRRAARADARAADDPGRRPHLLPRGPARPTRPSASSRSSPGSTATWA